MSATVAKHNVNGHENLQPTQKSAIAIQNLEKNSKSKSKKSTQKPLEA